MGFACVRDIATESIAYTRKKRLEEWGKCELCASFFPSVVFWTLAIVLES